MAFEELGLSRAEQIEIRRRALVGHATELAIEDTLPDLPDDLGAFLDDAAAQLAERFGVSVEEAKLVLAEQSAILLKRERDAEE